MAQSDHQYHAAPRSTIGPEVRPPGWKPTGVEGGDTQVLDSSRDVGGVRAGLGWRVHVEAPESSASSAASSGSRDPLEVEIARRASAMPVDDPVAVKTLTSQVRALARRVGALVV